MKFEQFKSNVNNLIIDGNLQDAINLAVNRYGAKKVDYYFNAIDVYKVGGAYLYQGDETVKDFELKDVIAKCEYN